MTQRTLRRITPKRIMLSGSVIAIALALVIGATGAFFNDEESSIGNVFTAGAIDLKIDNSSYINYGPNGEMIPVPESTWELRDLTDELFFNFLDVKPGDLGEDTISFHVTDNPAWLCADLRITANDDVSSTEPELEDGDVEEDDLNPFDGELAQNLNFLFWADDGDNVLEEGEEVVADGPASDVLDGDPYKTYPLVDSQFNVWGEDGTPIDGSQTYYLGKAWCFGDITPAAVAQDNQINDGPDGTRGPGVNCDGAEADNTTQTDTLVGDIRFRAVQERHNEDFICLPDVEWPTENGEEPVRPEVGAVLGDFEEPGDSCTDTVADGESIQAAIDAASSGAIICVEDGTHDSDTYPLRVNEDNLTLTAVNDATNTAVLTGGVIIDNPGVTVTGFHIDGESTLLGETFGVYVNTGATGATVSYNIIEGNDTNPSRGVVAATGLSGLSVLHNVISDWFTGVFLNPSSGMEVAYNTLTSNGVGSANDGPTGNSIHHNIIANNTIEGVGVSDATVGNAGSLSVNFNNIYGNPAGNQMNNYDLGADDNGFEVDAEDNWWGDATPGDNINGAGGDLAPIDFDPFEVAAFPEN